MKGPYRKNWILLIGLSIYYGVAFGVIISCFSLFLKPMSDTLAVPYVWVSSSATVRMLAGTLTTSLSGRVLPRVNFRVFISINALVLTLGAVLTATAQNLVMLYLGAILLGVGAGFGIYTIVPTLLNNWFQRPSPYIGIATSVGAAVGIFASVAFAALIETIGWRGSYWVIALLLLCVNFPICVFILRFRPADVGAQVYPGKSGESAAAVEQSLKQGMTNQQARKTAAFFIIAGSFIMVSLLSGMYSQISTALYAVGQSGLAVGIVTACYQCGTTAYNLGLGALCNRFHAANVMTISTITVALGGLGLMLSANGSIVLLAVFAFFLGGGRSLENVCGPALVRQMFGAKESGSIFSDLHAIMLIFSAFTAVIYGQIYTATKSYNAAYILMLIAAAIVATLLQIVRLRGRKAAKQW